MDVSIILVSYNTKDLTHDCIKSVYEKTAELNYDIWVADNDSNDGSAELIKDKFPDVNLIESKQNLGFGKANNLAIEKSTAKYVLFLNTDTVLVNNAVKIMFDYLESAENSNVGACGGQLYNSDMTEQGSFGPFETLKTVTEKCLGLNVKSRIERFKSISKKKTSIINQNVAPIEKKPLEVDFIIGADLMVRKSVIDEVGMFDPNFFMFAEEAELCFRIKKYGYKNVILTDAKIIHFGGQSINKVSKSIKVDKMRLEGKIKFFEACYGKKQADTVKFLYQIYYLRYLFLRFFAPTAFKRVLMSFNVD